MTSPHAHARQRSRTTDEAKTEPLTPYSHIKQAIIAPNLSRAYIESIIEGYINSHFDAADIHFGNALAHIEFDAPESRFEEPPIDAEFPLDSNSPPGDKICSSGSIKIRYTEGNAIKSALFEIEASQELLETLREALRIDI